jgi:ferredoxin
MAKVDQSKCIGCGACAAICPEVFEMGPGGKSHVKAQKNLPCVKDAAEACPVGAITV